MARSTARLARSLLLLALGAGCVEQKGAGPDTADTHAPDSDESPAPDDCDDPATWYPDGDGDGYGDGSAGVEDCEAPAGAVAAAGDCDDATAEINPDASERCDGVDNDCDGQTDEADAVDAAPWYTDGDQDGFGDPSTGTTSCSPPPSAVLNGEDCDDRLDTVYPGAPEICGDGQLNDCDGDLAEAMAACTFAASGSVSRASAKITGESAGDQAGWVGDAGDVNGDGVPDLFFGAASEDTGGPGAGAAYLVLSPVVGTFSLADATAKLTGEATEDAAGVYLSAAGDTNGDGYTDLLVGAIAHDAGGAAAGGTWVALGPVTGEQTLNESEAKLIGVASDDGAGAVAYAGDLDGDGRDDLLVGAGGNDDGGTRAGAAWVVLGPVSGLHKVTDAAAAQLTGEAARDMAGATTRGAGDVNGDGSPDLIIAASGQDAGGNASGAAYLVLGPVTADLNLGDADAKYIGEEPEDWVGHFVAGAGDTDGDGYADVLMGASGESTNGPQAGAAYLVAGPALGFIDLSAATAKLLGNKPIDYAGARVSTAGDADGDGLSDLLVGSWGADDGGDAAGATWLFFGPVSGVQGLSAAAATFLGESAGDEAGLSLAAAGDVNGDGRDDFLIGSAYEDSVGEDAGACYLLTQGF